jgi:beta-aspartyl-peptidase (threonine type)
VYLVAEGAERFAQQHGIRLCPNDELVIEREVERLREVQERAAVGRPPEFFAEHDTVGAVALDSRGNLAAATSTGGTLNKTPGRVGDSSLIGCGCYADNESAAVSTTGWGEPIMKLVLAKWAADRMLEGAIPEAAARMAIERLETRLAGHGGIILLDARGRYGLAHNTPRMAWALKSAHGESVGIECPSA